MYQTMEYRSPVGLLTIAGDEEAVAGLWIAGQKYFGGAIKDALAPSGETPVLAHARKWLDLYFAGKRPSPEDIPLKPAGSEFRQAVWRILLEIPYGDVMTYGEIAGRIAAERGLPSMSAQAVGGAVAHNPISILIPCHRVVGTDGSLTGYAGGIEVKRRLLSLEGVDISHYRG